VDKQIKLAKIVTNFTTVALIPQLAVEKVAGVFFQSSA
jgi:hypothetical protein